MESILNIKDMDKTEVVENFLKYEKSKIKSLFIWTFKGYRQFASMYRCGKKDFSTKICAFLNLWLAGLIDLEEWNNNYKGGEEVCSGIYDNFFSDYLERVNPILYSNKECREYIEETIREKIKSIKKNRAKDPVDKRDYNEANLIFNGIYENLKFVHEDEFKFEGFNPLISVKISEGDFYGEDFFVETDEEYILFME